MPVFARVCVRVESYKAKNHRRFYISGASGVLEIRPANMFAPVFAHPVFSCFFREQKGVGGFGSMRSRPRRTLKIRGHRAGEF